MPPVIVAIAVIAAVASTALAIKQGQDTKKAAKKQRDLEQNRLKVVAEQRRLTQQRNEAQLRKQARAKNAALINTAFGTGVRFTSSFAGASAAIAANQRGALGFSEQSAILSKEADDITSTQIDLNAKTIRRNATNQQIGAVVEGLGSIASSVAGGAGGSPSGEGAIGFGQ